MSSTNINKYQIIYYIVYYSKDILENAKPIITGTKAEAKKDALTHHLLTKEMFDTIEIFSNLLQLPRNAFDFIKVSYDDLFKITNHSHNIIHIPQYMVDSIIASFQFYYRDISTAGIVIYDPRTFEEANKLKNYLDPILGSVSYDEFKKCKPREIWKLVRDHFDYQNREQILIPSFDNFLKGSDLNGLPGFYYTMQNDDFDSFEKNLRRAKNKFEYTIRVLDDYNLRIKAMEASIGKFNKSKKQNKEIYKKEINDRQNINYKPLVLTVPGISNYQKRHLRAININEMNEIEIAAIKNLGLYRAMSRNAAYIEFKFIKQELFSILFNLEEHCL
ncbi:MAG: hypothetical protein NUK62_06630, partial [Tenericutes bacterium]|nr:hypothetical protein [Mycoplasmatota bacterium]